MEVAGSERFHRLTWRGHPLVRVILADIPELPLGAVKRLFVTGARALRVEAPLPGRLTVVAPGKDAVLTEDWVRKEWTLANLPEGTTALRTTILTALGALSIVTPGTRFSLTGDRGGATGDLRQPAQGPSPRRRAVLHHRRPGRSREPGFDPRPLPTFLMRTDIPTR